MPIAVSCPACGAKFQAKDEHAGRAGKCPKCQQPITVPALTPPPVETDEYQLAPETAAPRRTGPPPRPGAILTTAPANAANATPPTPAIDDEVSPQIQHRETTLKPTLTPPPARPVATGKPRKPLTNDLPLTIADSSAVGGSPSPTIPASPVANTPANDDGEYQLQGERTAAVRRQAAVTPRAAPPTLPPAPRSKDDIRTAQIDPQLQQAILAAFHGPIEPVHTGLMYRLGIALVTGVMILIPLAYVALVGFVGWLLVWHTTHDHVWLNNNLRGRAAALPFLAYVLPIVGGVILLFFMVKPIFARPGKANRTRSLTPVSDPLLFAFVERICQAVGAPMPRRIDVDCQVNASASFRNGLWSIFGHDLVLTIGLPLVAGLNLRQFAGVLAHEFGHFSQGAGMRLTLIIRTISGWLTRIVYERDSWDEWLQRMGGVHDSIALLVMVSQLFIWLTRKVLWVFMFLGHAVAGFMLRQMEFDADRHETRLAGSETFAQTSYQIHFLTVAAQGAYQDLDRCYAEGRLADDFPELVRANREIIPADVVQRLEQHANEMRTGLLDTHPCPRERIASAAAEQAPGVFTYDGPATVIFTDFRRVSAAATCDMYESVFGQEFNPDSLQSVAEVIKQGEDQEKQGKSLQRYFQGQFMALRPLPLGTAYLFAPEDLTPHIESLQAAREWTLANKAQYAEHYQEYNKQDSLVLEAQQAGELLGMGVKLKKGSFSFPVSDVTQARRARLDAKAAMESLGAQMRPFEDNAANRLKTALELLMSPQIDEKLADAPALRAEAQELLAALLAITQYVPDVIKTRDAFSIIHILIPGISANAENETFVSTLRRAARDCHSRLTDVYNGLSGTPYPFSHAQGPITLSTFAMKALPPSDELGSIYETTSAMLDKLAWTYFRTAGRLAEIAEQVEEAVGLPPLPQPEKIDAADKTAAS